MAAATMASPLAAPDRKSSRLMPSKRRRPYASMADLRDATYSDEVAYPASFRPSAILSELFSAIACRMRAFPA